TLGRWLTAERRRLLMAGDDDGLAFACALARQCFINEYVFAYDEDELLRATQLRETIATGGEPSPLMLSLLAAYVPLHSLSNARSFLDRAWPKPLEVLLDQQVRQPLEEADDRAHVPVLTAIDN